jgi:hypothetical protein
MFPKESALRGCIALPVREPRIKMSDSREEAASSFSYPMTSGYCPMTSSSSSSSSSSPRSFATFAPWRFNHLPKTKNPDSYEVGIP